MQHEWSDQVTLVPATGVVAGNRVAVQLQPADVRVEVVRNVGWIEYGGERRRCRHVGLEVAHLQVKADRARHVGTDEPRCEPYPHAWNDQARQPSRNWCCRTSEGD